MHHVVVVGILLIAILAGILFSRADVKELRTEFRSEIKDLRNELKDVRSEFKDVRSEIMDVRNDVKEFRREVVDHLGRIDADLRQFYHLTGTLEARMDSIEKR